MILYVLRHASAGSKKFSGARDEKRPLDAEGIEQCGLVGRALAALDVHVDAVLSSPLKRAAQTATLVANEIGFEGKLQLDPALRPEAAFDQFSRLLRGYATQEAILVVGHNPNLSEFLGGLIASPAAPARFDLKKGAVARVDLEHKRALLTWLITPKLARALRHQPESR